MSACSPISEHARRTFDARSAECGRVGVVASHAVPGWISPSGRASRIAAVALTACLSLTARVSADPSKADALFREGRRLLAGGQVAEACDKFAESQREDPSSGALLNLARCHADAGMTATAWTEYLAAAHLARTQQRPQQAAEAELRATELESRLIRLLIRLDPSAAGVVVTRNGEQIAPSALGAPIPVDPGNHVVRASAPGHADWSTNVMLAQPGQLRSITIPALNPLPRSTDAAPASPSKLAERHGQSATKAEEKPAGAKSQGSRTIPMGAWVAAGVGTAALAGTAVLAWTARSKWNAAHAQGLCDAAHQCSPEGTTQTDQARTLGNIATGTAVLSVAAFAGAVLFYVLDGSSRKGAARVGVAFASTSAELGVQGRF
jgi:hypothetical protein